MSSIQNIPQFTNQVQLPALPVSLANTGPPALIKIEPLESEISVDEESDIKDIDIVLHPLPEKLMQSKNILETKHPEVSVGTENAPFVKIENINESKFIMIEDSSDGNASSPPALIKIEPLESEISVDKESDIKNIDIVLHPLPEKWMQSENILETKHPEVSVGTENAPFVKIENINESEIIMIEDSSDGNASSPAGQEVVEVQGNLDNAINFSTDLIGIGASNGEAECLEKIDFARYYKTNQTTFWENDKMKVIKESIIPVKSNEYTLIDDNLVCNHCNLVFKKWANAKSHIMKMHRKDTTMYQCPHCPFKSKINVPRHFILNHKGFLDIQWFQCRLCEMKFKLKSQIIQHIKVHSTNKQMPDRSDLCLVCGKICVHKKYETRYRCKKCADKWQINYQYYHCDECGYATSKRRLFNKHKLTHLKPEDVHYFYCYHCPHKNRNKQRLTVHILRHFRNEEVPFHCYMCDFVTLKRDMFFEHFKKHSKHHDKLNEIKRKYQLETSERREKRYHCSKCSFKSTTQTYLKTHKLLTHSKPEEMQNFHCYHCSHKTKYKRALRTHIAMHFSNGDVLFHCYICDFMTTKRISIVEHLKKHREHHRKYDESEYKNEFKTRRIKRISRNMAGTKLTAKIQTIIWANCVLKK